MPVAYRYNAFARPVAKSLASVLPAHIPKGDPPDAYTGSFVSFVVLDKAVKQKPASAKEIVDWVENQTAEFCQLSDIEVVLLLCNLLDSALSVCSNCLHIIVASVYEAETTWPLTKYPA